MDLRAYVMPMIHQKSFYAALKLLNHTDTNLIAEFRQLGDFAEAGYLPNKSGGTCSFTALDFQRALSQGCEDIWMQEAQEAKKGWGFVQAIYGNAGTNFGLRQQINYVSFQHTINDPLFTRSIGPQEKLDEGVIIGSRKPVAYAAASTTATAEEETEDSAHESSSAASDDEAATYFTPHKVKSTIMACLIEDQRAHFRINFDLVENKALGNTYQHTIAICPHNTEPNSIYIMDPNAGVIKTTHEHLEDVLSLLHTKLYQDYSATSTHIEIQDKFWCSKENPITLEKVQQFRETEQELLNAATKADYLKLRERPKADEPDNVLVMEEDTQSRFTSYVDKTTLDDNAWIILGDKIDVAPGATETQQTPKATATPLSAKKPGDSWDRFEESEALDPQQQAKEKNMQRTLSLRDALSAGRAEHQKRTALGDSPALTKEARHCGDSDFDDCSPPITPTNSS